MISCAAADDLHSWTDYRAVMWVGNSAYKNPAKVPLFFQRLREMGINAATGAADGSVQPLVDQAFPYYVENVVNRGLCLKFNSNVRDWDAFTKAWVSHGRGEAELVRDYSLDDPKWLDWARERMQSVAQQHRANSPFAYDIRDELSTTISANPFDYDFSAVTLPAFRAWLKTQYADLAALNAEWQTTFARWDDVKPFTTDQIKARMASGEPVPRGGPDWRALQRVKFDPATARGEATRWNFAPWADFRTYMDISLANALGGIRTAARAIDPHTPVGIEGTQMPSAFGGYDLWRLAQVLDWIEPYDIGNAREILGSFMSGKPIMTTVFEKDTEHARRRLWHLLLEGDRGCIVWWSEDCIDWKSEDYALTAKAKALAPVLRELQSPLAELFRRAQPERDPIYLVYSQPSIQVDWLLESTADGPSWIRRFSSYEASHNRLAQKRGGWMKLLQDLGYTPQFVPAEKIAEVAPRGGQVSVLVFSDTLALGSGEMKATADFARHGIVLADGPVGVFDEHGRFDPKRTGDAFAIGKPPRDLGVFAAMRLKSDASSDCYAWAEKALRLETTISVPPETHTRIHRYRLGDARLIAFERNIDYHMSEDLKQAGGNESLEHAAEITARLATPTHVYDLRSGRYLGRTDHLSFVLDSWQPSLFALTPEKIAGDDVIAALRRKISER